MSDKAAVDVVSPIIVKLGKQKKKDISKLKRGEGKLMDEVLEVISEVEESLGEEVQGKILVPIVVLYEEKVGDTGMVRMMRRVLDEIEGDDDDDDDDD